MKSIVAATKAAGRIAIRIGTGTTRKCGVFAYSAPAVVVQAGVSLAARDRDQRIVLLALAGGGALGVVLTVAGGLFLTGRALAPVQLAFNRQRRFVRAPQTTTATATGRRNQNGIGTAAHRQLTH